MKNDNKKFLTGTAHKKQNAFRAQVVLLFVLFFKKIHSYSETYVPFWNRSFQHSSTLEKFIAAGPIGCGIKDWPEHLTEGIFRSCCISVGMPLQLVIRDSQDGTRDLLETWAADLIQRTAKKPLFELPGGIAFFHITDFYSQTAPCLCRFKWD